MRTRDTLPAYYEVQVQEGDAVEIRHSIGTNPSLTAAYPPRVVKRIKEVLGEPLLTKPLFISERIKLTFRSNIGAVTYYYPIERASLLSNIKLAYARKMLKQNTRKLRQREAIAARKGYYVGPNQRIVAPHRISDPTVPFMGEAELSHEERSKLRYWIVPAGRDGMDRHFPPGTGVALKEIHSSKELVPGAVYVWWMDDLIRPIIGRLLPRTRDQVHLHIRYDNEEWHSRYGKPTAWIEWKNSTIHICQVVYYTAQTATERAIAIGNNS